MQTKGGKNFDSPIFGWLNFTMKKALIKWNSKMPVPALKIRCQGHKPLLCSEMAHYKGLAKKEKKAN